MGFNNPRGRGVTRTRAVRLGRCAGPALARARRRQRGRQPGLVPKRRPTSRPPARPAGRRHALRRAALPLELQLPRRGQPPRGAGRGGRPPRASPRWPSRPRRVLRGGPLRRGRPGGGVPTVFEAELPRPDQAAERRGRPRGRHLLVLARRPEATPAWPPPSAPASWRGEKGKPDYTGVDWPAARGGHWLVLTGCRKGRVPPALSSAGRRPPPTSSTASSTCSGRTTSPSSCATTATRSTRPATTPSPTWPPGPACDLVATNNVHYASPARRRLATALAAVRARRSLDEIDGGFRRPAPPTCGRATSRPGASPATRGGRAGGRAGLACAFDLSLVAPHLPPYPTPAGPRRDDPAAPTWSRQGALRGRRHRPARPGRRGNPKA